MQLYYQNPRFGFHVIRLITGRLVENLRRVETMAGQERYRPSRCRTSRRPWAKMRPAPQFAGELRSRVRRRRLLRMGGGGGRRSS